jgi:hypothetical protein
MIGTKAIWTKLTKVDSKVEDQVRELFKLRHELKDIYSRLGQVMEVLELEEYYQPAKRGIRKRKDD